MSQNRLSDKARTKGRMAIYAMAGFYILYMAYSIFRGLPTSHGNEKILMIVFMILFAVVGAGMMVMGVYMGYKLSKETSDAMKKIEGEKSESLGEDSEEEKPGQ